MNKMAKGAIATGVGVILLAGGGGTLATWNASDAASMGSVVSGDLNLVADAGVWKNASGDTIQIANYKVVPGDTLTYTQPMTVTLNGDLMVAKLSLTGNTVNNGFVAEDVQVSPTKLTNASQTVVLASDALEPANSGQVIATTTFVFKESTKDRSSVNASYDFSDIGYKLVQDAPANSNGL